MGRVAISVPGELALFGFVDSILVPEWRQLPVLPPHHSLQTPDARSRGRLSPLPDGLRIRSWRTASLHLRAE